MAFDDIKNAIMAQNNKGAVMVYKLLLKISEAVKKAWKLIIPEGL